MTATSVKDLTADPTFSAFVAHWKANREPPLPFIDYLLEQEQYRAAGAVKWVLEEPLRQVYGESAGMLSRPFPFQYSNELNTGNWSWVGPGIGNDYNCADLLTFKDKSQVYDFPTLDSALLFLLEEYPTPLL